MGGGGGQGIVNYGFLATFLFKVIKFFKFIILSQVYNSKQHEIHVQHFKYGGNFTVGKLTVVYFSFI